jgi:hypothetical protein
MLLDMITAADIVVGATTEQQADASPGAVPSSEELPYRAEAVADLTLGSPMFVSRSFSLGRASSYLAAAGDAILGDRTFDDESVEIIREARKRP